MCLLYLNFLQTHLTSTRFGLRHHGRKGDQQKKLEPQIDRTKMLDDTFIFNNGQTLIGLNKICSGQETPNKFQCFCSVDFLSKKFGCHCP